ncbi:MAG: 50S ribosomal protein L18 [Candidatus Woesearchaeota archaeon]|nr:50S ribosomal protein L18 [Candidatus Woesearchaeota archaeon]
MTSKIRTVPYRRKGAGKTDYRRRLKLLKSRTPRLVIRVSLKHIAAQAVSFSPEGDRVLASAHTRELAAHGWTYGNTNQPAAYLLGLLMGAKAKKAKITTLIPDLGLGKPVKRSVLYTVVKGVKDAGVHVPVADEVLPDEKRVNGEHISEYSKKIKAERSRYEKQFSGYIKKGLNPEDMPKRCQEIKAKLLKQ